MSAKCKNREDLELLFSENGISFETVQHEEVFTVEALMEHSDKMPGFHHKNLFLRDKKRSKFYLLVTEHDRPINLNSITKALSLGSGNLRFGPEDKLEELLGIRQGAVTIFGLVNDVQNKVQLLLDSEIVNKGPEAKLWFHPLENNASTGITVDELKKFLQIINHEARYVRFDNDSVSLIE